MAWISFKTSLKEDEKQGVRLLIAQAITLCCREAPEPGYAVAFVRIASR
jgi:hypothetical protein